jgi:hypothetical protein
MLKRAGSGDSPIHDRWILGSTGGLRLGTSFNSMGIGKLSEISTLTTDEFDAIAAELERFIRRERVIDGFKVEYQAAYL